MEGPCSRYASSSCPSRLLLSPFDRILIRFYICARRLHFLFFLSSFCLRCSLHFTLWLSESKSILLFISSEFTLRHALMAILKAANLPIGSAHRKSLRMRPVCHFLEVKHLQFIRPLSTFSVSNPSIFVFVPLKFR